MITISFIFPPLVWALLGMGLVAAVVATMLAFGRFSRLRRGEPCEAPVTGYPAATVVALAREEEDLHDFIDAVIAQDYPDYEVIIVQEATKAVNSTMSERYPFSPRVDEQGNPIGCRALRFCFYPPGSHAVSRRKLALTIAIKAAENPVIVTTDTYCLLPGEKWLPSLMRHFNDSTDVVLGYVEDDYSCFPAGKRGIRRFCGMMTSGQWIAEAIDGNPYRGDGRNMAYRRQLFFDHKGFSDSIDLVSGEDDIFVSAIADAANTAVELSDTSVVLTENDEESCRKLADAYERYRFTSRYLDRRPFVKAGIASALQWLAILSLIVASLLALPHIGAAIIAVVLIAAMAVAQAILYRRGAETLGLVKGANMAAFFLALRPIFNAWCDFKARKHTHNFYTYKRG